MSQMHSRTEVEKMKLTLTTVQTNILNKHWGFFNAKIEKRQNAVNTQNYFLGTTGLYPMVTLNLAK